MLCDTRNEIPKSRVSGDILEVMALFLKQDDQRSELQKRIAAELNRKAGEKHKITKSPDGVDDSQFVKNTASMNKAAWIWVSIILAVLIFIIWLTVTSTPR